MFRYHTSIDDLDKRLYAIIWMILKKLWSSHLRNIEICMVMINQSKSPFQVSKLYVFTFKMDIPIAIKQNPYKNSMGLFEYEYPIQDV